MQTRNSAFKIMNFALKMMNFALKIMNFAAHQDGLPIRRVSKSDEFWTEKRLKNEELCIKTAEKRGILRQKRDVLYSKG